MRLEIHVALHVLIFIYLILTMLSTTKRFCMYVMWSDATDALVVSC